MEGIQDERTPLLNNNSINASGVCPGKAESAAKLPQLLATFSASLAGIAVGFVLGFPSPIIPELINEGILTTSDASWFAAIPTLSAIIGGLVSGFLIEWQGRKVTIMTTSPLAVTGWLLITATTNVPIMLVGRALTGVAIGMISLSVPVYVAEVSSKELRGGLGAMYQTSVNCGVFLSYCFSIPLRSQWLSVVSACVPTLCIVLMVFMPESPRWLQKHSRHNDAKAALLWLRGPHYDTDGEQGEIRASLESQDNTFRMHEFRKPVMYKPFMMCLVLMAIQQLGGIRAIGTYAQYILQESGFSSNAKHFVVIQGIVGAGGTIVSCIIQDRFGRRSLLIFSGIVCSAAMAALGTYHYQMRNSTEQGEHTSPLRWLALASVLVYAGGYSVSWGPTVWLLVAELLPTRAKGFVASLATMINWTIGFLVAKEFLDLEKVVNNYGAFWTFCITNILGVLFIAVAVPETQGRSLEEIQKNFECNSHQDAAA